MPPTDAADTAAARPRSRRALMIAPTPYFADRGCHVRILEEARALQANGVDVTIAAYPLGRTIPGIETVRTVKIPWYRKLEAGPSVHKIYIDGLLWGLVLREIRRRKPDVLHAHLHEGAAIGIAARALTGVPVVFDIQGSLADEMAAHGAVRPGGAAFRALTAIERRLYRWSDALIVNSEAARAMLAEKFSVPEARMHVAPDAAGVPDRAPDPAAVRKELGVDGGPVIGYLGLMTEYQGVGTLVDAIPKILEKRPDARVLMMGFPDEAYRRRVADAGLAHAVRFTGRVPYEEIGRYLSAVDVAVSPKVISTEGNGKLFTYLAMGLPTVAFDTPINREIIGSNGVLVSPISPDALAEALVRALDSPPATRSDSGALSWDDAVAGTLRAYDDAIARRGRR
ncbi:MAG: glycosyltransferase family 4 protein [Actinomycetota bacterium]